MALRIAVKLSVMREDQNIFKKSNLVIFSTLQIDMNGHPFNSLEKTGTIM